MAELPVSIAVEVKPMLRLLILARRCAEDLIAEVEGANPGEHPVTLRKVARDTQDARALLALLDELVEIEKRVGVPS